MAGPRGAVKQKAKRAQKTLTQEMSILLAKTFLPDLTARSQQPAVARALRERWLVERDDKRTAAGLNEWVSATIEQVGAAWILSCVFVRVLEDRGFLERRRIAGEGADDSLQQFLEIAPSLTERDYLLTVFRELATYPGAADVLDPAHNPAWRLSPSNDSVRALLALLREADADGKLRFSFTREETRDTRFLGDLYQDLSESVRKRHALLQTPDFVERFILDQTLEPAIAEFGLEAVRLIDPTCGSGHFLLGAFHRLFEHRQRVAPGLDRRDHARATLAQIYGIDINPYAVAIARFRLTLAYLEHAGIDRLALAPRIETNLVVADSLLHGTSQGRLSDRAEDKAAWGDQLFALDDPAAARQVLDQRYHAVVGNPPYITCKDPLLREAYRENYDSAAGKYALSAPFTERFFQLAEPGGYVGMINANSFMKREFGKALIERVLPRVELTEVIDTSGAYIPGHGTPTVLLFGRNRTPVAANVHVVMGKRGEPTTPADPEKGHVWSAVAAHHRDLGFENDYLSVAEITRETLSKHPWSLGGGGAAELKELLEARCAKRLGDLVTSIGFMAIAGEDEVFVAPIGTHARWGLPSRDFGIGESIRDWACTPTEEALFPYNEHWEATAGKPIARRLWPFRSLLQGRLMFGKTQIEAGLEWFEYRHVGREKLRTPLSIAFAFVATHNHFILDRGGKVFNRSAPIIKLPAGTTEDDHLALLAYLNSSTACFWMKQVFFNKGNRGEGGGTTSEEWEKFYEFAGTKMAEAPIPKVDARFAAIGLLFSATTSFASELTPDRILQTWTGTESLSALMADARERRDRAFGRIRCLQEELDWLVYETIGLVEDGLVEIPSAPKDVPGSCQAG